MVKLRNIDALKAEGSGGRAYSGDSGHLFPIHSATPPGGGATLELTDGSSAHRVGDFMSFDAFLKMEVIHSPGATSFNQLGRSGVWVTSLPFDLPFAAFPGKGGWVFWGSWSPFDSRRTEEIFYRMIRESQALIFSHGGSFQVNVCFGTGHLGR